MAELQASWIQASSHPADTDRLVLEGLMNPPGAPVSGARYGVGSGDTELKIQAKGTPDMSVDVLAGHAWIDGTENANQGAYHVYNDATKNLTIAAAHATNPRKDLVIAKVQDAQYSGATNAWSLAVVTGTPAASPAEPTVPANAIVLALVDVAALASSITNANITDRRRRASALGGIVVCTSATRPTTGLYEGLFIYETDTDRVYFYTGAAWTQIGATDDPPSCRVYNNASQAVVNSSVGETVLTFNTELFDPDGMHSAGAPTRITFPLAGVYLVTASAIFAASTDYTSTNLRLRVDGSAPFIADDHGGTVTTGAFNIGRTVTAIYKFNAGQYCEVLAGQSNTTVVSRNVLGVSNGPSFAACWLGRG